MSRAKREQTWDRHQMVPTDHMVPDDPITEQLPLDDPKVPESQGDGYWQRAMGKAPAPPVVSTERRAGTDSSTKGWGNSAEPAPERDTYWDRARGAAARRPVRPERTPESPKPAAAVTVTPPVPRSVTEDTVTVPTLFAAPGGAPVARWSPVAAQSEAAVRGAHVRNDDPLLVEVRCAHVKADEPLVGAARDAHVAADDAVVAEVRGAHAFADGPLEAEVMAVPAKALARRAEDSAYVSEPALDEAEASRGRAAHAKSRRRHWRLVPISGAAALAAGLGGGGAYAYFTSSGSGTGQATTGMPSNVVLGQATIGTVSSYLVPGGTGDLFVKVNNPNNQPVTITGISQTGGVTVSGGVGSCTSDPSWPGTLGTSGVSVPTNNTLNISVPGLSGSSYQVDIPNAASMTAASATGCQSATFQIPVTITVRMG